MEKVVVIPYRKIRSQRTITLLGKISLGSSLIGLIGTFFLLNSISILYEYDMYSKAQPIPFYLAVFFQIIVNIFLFLTVLTDPGVIPQQIRRYEVQQQLFIIPIAEEPTIPPRSYGIPQGNLFPEIKYCEECRIYRPVRTIHCGKCNHCVQIFDHHCTWIGVCIGKKNYRYFMGFCISLWIHLLICIAFIIQVFLINLKGTVLEVIGNTAIIIFVFLVSIFFLISVGYLVGYQLNLLKRGINMNQDLKSLYTKTCLQPFKKGNLCFRRNAPSFKPQNYHFKVWNQLLPLDNNSDASTQRTHRIPLLVSDN